MFDVLNESTRNPWKVDYLFTIEVPQKWILNFSTSIQVLHNESIGITPVDPMWLSHYVDALNAPKVYYFNPLKSRLSLHIWKYWNPLKSDPQCKAILNFSTSIQVLHNESIAITPVAPMWLRYVWWILNESSTKIPWKVDYLFTAVVLKLKKCPKSGYWISVHRLHKSG